MNKYRNIKTEVDGIVFDSRKEARRYGELKLLQKAGKIFDLKLHPSFPLHVNGLKICTYKADFLYTTEKYSKRVSGGLILENCPEPVVEDVKGVKTPVYNLKKKLMKAIYGIEIQEI